MKVRTSVTLPRELLVEVDALAGKKHKRSAIVETALRDYVAKETGKELNRRDIEIINKNAEMINKQVEETLQFQAEW
jgi:metal-responsive CopG/Arc/MetJ family transcriptional regulator